MSSAFNPDQFLDATTTEASTRRDPLPVGDYQAEITDLATRQWQGKKDPTMSGIAADLKVKVLTSSNPAAAGVGLEEITIRDSIMLDTNDGGGLDMSKGKNGRLRMYREALGMNQPGQPFSLRAMVGRTLKVRIKHETYEGNIQERIDAPVKG